MKPDVSLFNDVVNHVKDDVKDLAAHRAEELASSHSESNLSLKDDVSHLQQEVRNLTECVEILSKLSDHADKDAKRIFQAERTSGSFKAIANDLEDQVEELAQIASGLDNNSMNDEVNQVKDGITNSADQKDELEQMSNASQWQGNFLEESLASSSNSETALSPKDDASHVQQEVRNLTGRVEEISKSSERSLLAHTELKTCMEKHLESLTALIGDLADKHAKEVDARVDKQSEAFMAITCDLEGRVEALDQIAGQTVIRLSKIFSSTNDEMSQIKDDVKDLTAQIKVLAQMSQASRLQCNSLEESLVSPGNNKSVLFLKDDASYVQQEVRDLTGVVEDLSKVSASSLSLTRDDDIWVAHSELKTWMEINLKSLAALVSVHADKYSKEIEALAACMETNLESQAASIGDIRNLADQMEELAQMSESSQWQCKFLEESLAKTKSILSLRDDVSHVQQEVRKLTGRVEELPKLRDRSLMLSRDCDIWVAHSELKTWMETSLESQAALIGDHTDKHAKEIEALVVRMETSLESQAALIGDHADKHAKEIEARVARMETRLESQAALIGEDADKHAKEIESFVAKISGSFKAMARQLEGRVGEFSWTMASKEIEAIVANKSGSFKEMARDLEGGVDEFLCATASIAGGSHSNRRSSMNKEVNRIKDDIKDLAAQIEELSQMNEASRLQCESLEESLASSSKGKSILSLIDDVSNVQQEVRNLTGRLEEVSEFNERSLLLSRDKDTWVARSELKTWMETSLEPLTTLMTDHADKHSKEIEALVGQKSESFMAIICDLEGRIEALAQIAGESAEIAGGSGRDSTKQDFSSMNDKVNQVKYDVKDLATQMEELAQMGEVSRLQGKSLEESLAKSKSILSLRDDVSHVQQEVRKLTGCVEELPKLRDRSLMLSRDCDIWVAHSELNTWMEASLESQAALIGGHADKHAKEIEALVAWMETSLESQAALIGDIKNLADQME